MGNDGQIDTKNLENDWKNLLNYLELARLYNYTIFIPQLEYVNTSEKIIEVDGDAGRGFFYSIYFFTHEIIHFQRIGFVVAFIELKRNG